VSTFFSMVLKPLQASEGSAWRVSALAREEDQAYNQLDLKTDELRVGHLGSRCEAGAAPPL